MTIKQIQLTMSKRQFRTLLSAVEYAIDQLETDIEKSFDDDHDEERRQLALLVEELWAARKRLLAKGANV